MTSNLIILCIVSVVILTFMIATYMLPEKNERQQIIKHYLFPYINLSFVIFFSFLFFGGLLNQQLIILGCSILEYLRN